MPTGPLTSLPNTDQSADCPHCKTKAAAYQRAGAFDWTSEYKTNQGGQISCTHIIRAAYCRSCAEPVIAYIRQNASASQRATLSCSTTDEWLRTHPHNERIIWPKEPSRDPASPEVRAANAALADDFDEAVACEPHSKQATVILLGRCASIVLMDKCKAPDSTLRPQFDHASKAGSLPKRVDDEYKAFTDNRNRAAHPWFDATGGHLRVEQDDVEWAFEIMHEMFEHFYIDPARQAARQARMNAVTLSKVKP